MKWKVVLAVLVLCAVGAYVWAARPERATPVFRDLCWGDPPESLGPKRLLRAEKPPHAVYMKIDDDLHLGDLALSSISYHFKDNKLSSIVVVATDYEKLASAAALKYANAATIKHDEVGTWYSGIDETTTVCVIERYTGYGGTGRMILMDVKLDVDKIIDKTVQRANSW